MPDPDQKPLPKSVPLAACAGWSIRELKLPRDEMADAIKGMISVPTEYKTAYIALIRLVPDKFRFIRFDAHAQIIGGEVIEHAAMGGF